MFDSLMKTKSGFLIVTLTKVELITIIKVLCTCEYFIECIGGDSFFLGWF